MKNWNSCDNCGKFIAIKDFENNKAIRRLIMPDNIFKSEEFETLCPKCLKNIDKPNKS